MIILIYHTKKYDGAGLPVTRVHPAAWSSAIAGQIGPFLSSSSSKATPRYSSLTDIASCPLFMSSKIPRTPSFLKL